MAKRLARPIDSALDICQRLGEQVKILPDLLRELHWEYLNPLALGTADSEEETRRHTRTKFAEIKKVLRTALTIAIEEETAWGSKKGAKK